MKPLVVAMYVFCYAIAIGMGATVMGYSDCSSFGVVWLFIASVVCLALFVPLTVALFACSAADLKIAEACVRPVPILKRCFDGFNLACNIFICGALIHQGYTVVPTIYLLLIIGLQSVGYAIMYVAKQTIKKHEDKQRDSGQDTLEQPQSKE